MGGMSHDKSPFWLLLIIPGVLAVLSGAAISAQDKYTLQVPGGLAFSEFRGYEGWPVIAISENEGLIAAIVGNPVMIDAYKEGVPGNGKLSQMALRWRSIGARKSKKRTPDSQWCQVPNMTLISW
jgi:hypothetical protein